MIGASYTGKTLISDVPTIETDQYRYYENGTHQCYHLFNSKAKITTYKSLKWHMLSIVLPQHG